MISNREVSKLKLKKEDVRETFVRSSGPGGQNVNKLSTCVCLKHLPTGIVVKCQKERSQAANRYLARKILVEKVQALVSKRIFEERQLKARQLRKEPRRPKRVKEKILESKRLHSRKKSLRSRIRDIDAYL